MDLHVAKMIVESAEFAGIEASVYENYSGRGMFGKTTTGIVIGNHSDFVKCVVDAIDLEVRMSGVLENAIERVSRIRTNLPEHVDNMGRDIILY